MKIITSVVSYTSHKMPKIYKFIGIFLIFAGLVGLCFWQGWNTATPALIPLTTAFIALPMVQNWYNKPVIKLSFHSPKDNINSHWSILIKNDGGVVNKGALYLVEQKAEGEKKQSVHPVRFRWPYEADVGKEDRDIILQDPSIVLQDTLRSIVISQYVYFFYNGPKKTNWDHLNKPLPNDSRGELDLIFPPSDGNRERLIKIPQKEGESLYLRVEVIGENYQSPEDEWFCITKNTQSTWKVEQKKPACLC